MNLEFMYGAVCLFSLHFGFVEWDLRSSTDCTDAFLLVTSGLTVVTSEICVLTYLGLNNPSDNVGLCVFSFHD